MCPSEEVAYVNEGERRQKPSFVYRSNPSMIIITDAAATFDVDAIPSALVSVLLKNRC